MNTGPDNVDQVLAGIIYAPESGISTTYYDDVTVNSSFIGTTPATAYQNIGYTYDAVGNITTILDASQTTAAGTTTYAYDPLNRLTGATSTQTSAGNWSQNYSYYAIGNITYKSDVGSYTYAGTGYANPHAVTSAGTTTYAYDASGNLTSVGSTTYAYDYKNQLTQTSTGVASTTRSYVYDDSTTWSDWSWDTTLDPNNTSPVYQGSKSLKLTFTALWSGLYLHSDTGVPVATYPTVSFAINGGSTGHQTFYVSLYKPDETYIGSVYLPTYISDLAPNTWYQVSIPAAAFGATSTIGGFSLESPATTTAYLDEIRFEGQSQGSGTTTRYLYDHQGQRTAYFAGSATTTQKRTHMSPFLF